MKTINYAEVYTMTKQIVEGDGMRVNLLETLAERIAQKILSSFSTISGVKINVKKP